MSTLRAAAEARSWLQNGQAPVDRVGDVSRALVLLSGEVEPVAAMLEPPLALDVETALVQEADERGMVALLVLLGDHAGDRSVRKLARKALFRARQRGVDIVERGPGRAPVRLAPAADPLPSWCSSYDDRGGQVIVLGAWTAADGPCCAVALMSDTLGLKVATWVPGISRTRLRHLIDGFKQDRGGLFVEVPPEFAAGRVRWAIDRADADRRPVEGEVAIFRRVLAGVAPIDDFEAALDPEDEARVAERIDCGAQLCDQPAFEGWLSGAGAYWRPLYEQVQVEAVALTELDDAALDARLIELRTNFVSAAFDEANRRRYAERLELTAWLLARDGQREAALCAISSARGLRDPQVAAGELPFIAGLAARVRPLEELRRRAGRLA